MIIANVFFGRFGTKSEGNGPMYRYLSKSIRLKICLREVLPSQSLFPTTLNLSIAPEDIRPPNTMTSVTIL